MRAFAHERGTLPSSRLRWLKERDRERIDQVAVTGLGDTLSELERFECASFIVPIHQSLNEVAERVHFEM